MQTHLEPLARDGRRRGDRRSTRPRSSRRCGTRPAPSRASCASSAPTTGSSSSSRSASAARARSPRRTGARARSRSACAASFPAIADVVVHTEPLMRLCMFHPVGAPAGARLGRPHRRRPRAPAGRADAAVVLHRRRDCARARRVPAATTSCSSRRCSTRRRCASSTTSRRSRSRTRRLSSDPARSWSVRPRPDRAARDSPP